MSLLIPGWWGFIGSNFINDYLAIHPSTLVVNLDCLNYCASKDHVHPHPNYKFIKGNICNKDMVNYILLEYHIKTVIHFAAQTHVDNSFDQSLQFNTDNIFGTHVLIQACTEYKNLD